MAALVDACSGVHFMVTVGLSILVDVVARHLPVPLVIAPITRASPCSVSVSYAEKTERVKKGCQKKDVRDNA